ncbi:hypothetical protein B0H66DRAFT_27376 [Apodospora peruviana]|uniref:Uncharacterized protein n=1 Tax=Apodospora peruviana TaxID=516989 RepID=A0AAE0IS19_9PEZI|nr:hypothetical protein B0H66DRAFT_27376 [Apodospora peruviana]
MFGDNEGKVKGEQERVELVVPGWPETSRPLYISRTLLVAVGLLGHSYDDSQKSYDSPDGRMWIGWVCTHQARIDSKFSGNLGYVSASSEFEIDIAFLASGNIVLFSFKILMISSALGRCIFFCSVFSTDDDPNTHPRSHPSSASCSYRLTLFPAQHRDKCSPPQVQPIKMPMRSEGGISFRIQGLPGSLVPLAFHHPDHGRLHTRWNQTKPKLGLPN